MAVNATNPPHVERLPKIFSEENIVSLFDLSHLKPEERYWLSWDVPAVVIPIYLAVILSLWAFMRNKKPLSLTFFKAAHNAFLCLLSLAMAVMTAYHAFKAWQEHGLKALYCDESLLTGNLWFWSAVFYWSKYYELFDTLLLVLCKKPLTFLHVYHHSIIIILCLTMMQQRMTFFFSGVIINATIHTFMYYYYSIASYGGNVWWKKHLTSGQIIQFVWGFSSWWPFLSVCNSCANDKVLFIWYFNQFVLFSFLVLFYRFFRATYSRPRLPAKKTE
jgi:fatty acid elongase 3